MSLEQDKEMWAETCRKNDIPADFIKWFNGMTEQEFYAIMGSLKVYLTSKK